MKLLDAVILCGTAPEKLDGERKRACGMDDARSFWIRHVCVHVCMYLHTHPALPRPLPLPTHAWDGVIEIYHGYKALTWGRGRTFWTRPEGKGRAGGGARYCSNQSVPEP